MTIAIYRQYRQALKKTKLEGQYVAYEWESLSNGLNAAWLPYARMFDEFSREIANSLNQLTDYVTRLKAWSMVIASMEDRQKMDATHEFIDPLATIALNLPYVIRSRFIFATAHLCHQANRSREGAAWKDDLPLNDEIYFEAANKYGGRWKNYKNLKLRLEKISAKRYQEGTHNFRNTYNHRFSPRIVIGITQFVTRHVDKRSGKVTYGLGGTAALDLDIIVKLLIEQCDNCRDAFEAFQKLIGEHKASISDFECRHA